MDDLERLIAEKKAIEEKIRMLRNQKKTCGRFKIDVEHYPTGKADRHYLACYYKPLDNGRPKYMTMYSAHSKQEVIDAIPGMIDNLQKLYDAVTGEQQEGD